MESDLLNNLNLLFAFFLGGTVFFAFIGIVWRVQSEQMARTATEKSREVGADEETLNQLRRRKSILLRWSDQYDQGESADELRAQLSRANLKIKPSEYQTYRVIGMVVVAIVLYYFVSLNFGVALGVGLLLARFSPPGCSGPAGSSTSMRLTISSSRRLRLWPARSGPGCRRSRRLNGSAKRCRHRPVKNFRCFRAMSTG